MHVNKFIDSNSICSIHRSVKVTGKKHHIELSEKVLTSADRLRCTLIHEMCHAATWIFNNERGHGARWKQWARKSNYVFPELPVISVCHNYDIEYKYTYKCDMCHSKYVLTKVICSFKLIIQLNSNSCISLHQIIFTFKIAKS